jgi:histidinol-phosphate aminotransferase
LLHKVRQPFNVTSLAQAAVLAGMDDADHVRRTIDNNAQGIAYLEREFKRMGLAYVPSHANFILLEVDAGNPVFDQLLKRGVIVRPMGAYGWPRHLRISVGLPEENRKLIAALEAIATKR